MRPGRRGGRKVREKRARIAAKRRRPQIISDVTGHFVAAEHIEILKLTAVQRRTFTNNKHSQGPPPRTTPKLKSKRPPPPIIDLTLEDDIQESNTVPNSPENADLATSLPPPEIASTSLVLNQPSGPSVTDFYPTFSFPELTPDIQEIYQLTLDDETYIAAVESLFEE